MIFNKDENGIFTTARTEHTSQRNIRYNIYNSYQLHSFQEIQVKITDHIKNLFRTFYLHGIHCLFSLHIAYWAGSIFINIYTWHSGDSYNVIKTQL